MAQIPEQIASLLIPMIGKPLLLPNVSVAEIVGWTQPEKDAEAVAFLPKNEQLALVADVQKLNKVLAAA